MEFDFDLFLPVPGLTLKAVNHDPPASSGLGWLAGREGLTKQSANLLNNNKQSCVSRLKKSQETPQGENDNGFNQNPLRTQNINEVVDEQNSPELQFHHFVGARLDGYINGSWVGLHFLVHTVKLSSFSLKPEVAEAVDQLTNSICCCSFWGGWPLVEVIAKGR